MFKLARFLFLTILLCSTSLSLAHSQPTNTTEIEPNSRIIMVRIVWQPPEQMQVPIKSVTARIPSALERIRNNPILNVNGGKSIFTVGGNFFVYRARPLNRTLINFCAYTGFSVETELKQKLPAIVQAFQEEIPVLRTMKAVFYIIPQYSEYQPLIMAFGPNTLSNTLNPGSEILNKYFFMRELYEDYLQLWGTLNATTPPIDYTKLKELEDQKLSLQRELVKLIAKDKGVPEHPDLIYRVHELYDPRSPQAIELNPKYLEWLELNKQQEQIFRSCTDYFVQYARSKGLEPQPLVLVAPNNLDFLVPVLTKN